MHHHPRETMSEQQELDRLDAAKTAEANYAQAIDALIPDGSHKTNIMHKIKTVALVINEVITHTHITHTEKEL